jgi:ribosomal protein S18 acetylase RimI-like enzyme
VAALPDLLAPELIDLSRVRTEDLQDLLVEERTAWRALLSWDFTPSAELVNRFVSVQALRGFGLVERGVLCGYCYFVVEERKAILGDLYTMKASASAANEWSLLSATLQSAARNPQVNRIEAQLLMLRHPAEHSVPLQNYAQVYPRLFMIADLDDLKLPERIPAPAVKIEPWRTDQQEEIAGLITSSYHGHVDASINDQYRTYAGARRFLHNIVNYPGCGAFLGAASLTARGPEGKLAGVVLSSKVAEDTGHVTQVCVAPEWQGRGVGYELMRQSAMLQQANGCTRSSLTVTASNVNAVQLYQRMGFRAVRRFPACVWEGF